METLTDGVNGVVPDVDGEPLAVSVAREGLTDADDDDDSPGLSDEKREGDAVLV